MRFEMRHCIMSHRSAVVGILLSVLAMAGSCVALGVITFLNNFPAEIPDEFDLTLL